MFIPNALTILRIVLASICLATLVAAKTSLGYFLWLAVFLVAVLTDYADGRIARRLKLETNFGKILDPIADKILALSAFIGLSYRGVFSFWWIVPIAFREILVTAVRIRRLNVGEVLPAERAGKIKVAIQFTAIGIAFLVFLVMENHVETRPFGKFLQSLLTALLVLTNAATLYSGALFFKNLKPIQ